MMIILDNHLDKIIKDKKNTINKKYLQLGISAKFEINDRFVNKKRNNKDKIDEILYKDNIFNLSNRKLSQTEESVLEKGLKFGITAKKFNKLEIIARFEILAESLRNSELIDNNENNNVQLDARFEFYAQLRLLAFEFIKFSEQAIDNLSVDERKALEDLAKDKNIIISKADKGNSVVIQNKTDYLNKATDILKKDNKFKLIDNHVVNRKKENIDITIFREKRLHGYIKKTQKELELPNEVVNRILPCGSRAGVLYGLPKIHKEGAPVRPIISAISTYNYKLAKYLDEILKPLVNNKVILKDTFDFVNKISNINMIEEQRIVSFDVESLFTNIPVNETIEIILERAFKEQEKFHGLDKPTLRKFLDICTKESHFQFNGQYYDQVDGVAMGSPLGPLFANIFMDEFENKHMEKLKELGLQDWFRYVVDIFATINNQKSSKDILEYLNNQHECIKFTLEEENNNQLPFLDTLVKRKEQGYYTTVYHKKTFTGVYLNWNSLTSRKYKIKLIYCLCDRIWKISLNEEDRNFEFNKLRTILIKNDYPDHIIDREIDKFITNRTNTITPTNCVLDENNSNIVSNNNTNNEKTIKYIALPFTHKKADMFAKKLSNLVETNFKNIELRVAFTTPNTVGKLFPFKDNIKETKLHSLVVYSIKCETCGKEYIGKTERILAHRISEHNKKDDSAIQQHLKDNPTHIINAENAKIIDSADNNRKLMLKEAFRINKHKPELNTQHTALYKSKNKDGVPFGSLRNTIIFGCKE